VKIANIAQIVNVIAPILTRGDDLLRQSIYYTLEMYSKRREGIALQVQLEGPTYLSKKYGTASFVDASAILDGDKVHVFAVNRSLTDSMDLTIKIADAPVKSLETAQFLTGKDAKSTNTFEHPTQVVSCDHDDFLIRDGAAIVSLPPLCAYAGTLLLDR
jgi:alpha-N-arabinofuranosidase